MVMVWHGMGSYISVPPIALRVKQIPYQRPMVKSPSLLLSLSKSLAINDQNGTEEEREILESEESRDQRTKWKNSEGKETY